MSEAPPIVQVRGAVKRYGARTAVDGVDLDLRAGRITALLGASGSGKSSLLRLIAGLERLDAGEIHADGAMLDDGQRFVAPERRPIGLVFQDYALFPHLNVVDNVAFGLTGPRAERRRMARDWLTRVGLGDRARAWPHELSGGEQQRVALVRTLARRPRAVLLDEPFSGLDRHLRHAVRDTLVADLRQTDAAVLVVTHDAEEALMMADDLALLDRGRLLQVATPSDAYAAPASPEAARLLGEADLIPAMVRDGLAETAFGAVAAPDVPDGNAWLLSRPEVVAVEPGGVAEVTAVRFGGPFVEVSLRAEGQVVRSRSVGQTPQVGDRVGLRFDPRRVRFFPRA